LDPTEQIHQVGDWNNYRNSPLSDFPKTINPTGESLEEDSPEVEDSLEVEDSPEVEDSLEAADSPEVEDSLEEADTQVEAEYRLEDHQEAGGDHHRFLCHKPNKENW